MDKVKALLIARNADGSIAYAINLWHEQARNRSISREEKTKAQLKTHKVHIIGRYKLQTKAA